MSSIRRYLTLVLIASLTLICFGAAIQGYQLSMQKASSLFDAELSAVSYNLLIPDRDNAIVTPSPDSRIAVQIWQDTQLTLRSANSPQQPMAIFQNGFSEQNFASQRWRVMTRQDTATDAWVMVAHPISERYVLAEELVLAAMTPLTFSIPLLAILIYALVNWGLSPLRELARQLSQRSDNDLQLIHMATAPRELQPVLGTLNSLLARLSAAFNREQQFASNAAHELRTPLSVMKINLHNLGKQIGQHPLLTQLQSDTDRMIQAVTQLLLLARTNPEYFNQHLDTLDPVAVAQSCIADKYSAIEAKQQNIELESEPCSLWGSEFALTVLLQNLIGNAAKFTPEGGQIRVIIKPRGDQIIIRVEDSGPGLEPDEYDKVLQRYYRSADDQLRKQEGTGLGLAIVVQITQLHHGAIQLSRSDLGGLGIEISLPVTVQAKAGADD